MADQYETYEVQLPAGYENETLTVNGTLTSEENVADNIGLQVAFTSFLQNEADKLWEPLEGLEMFSREQIFFIAHAQVSTYTICPVSCRSLVQTKTFFGNFCL